MNEQQRNYLLQTMGIEVWQAQGRSRSEAAVAQLDAKQEAIEAKDNTVLAVNSLDWSTLRDRVSFCELCDLHKTRTHTVFGVGNPNADLVIVGEAPGHYEDKQGEPFVGRAGKLLDAMLTAIGLRRENIFIMNILKCRPPNNRDPKPEEVATCTPYLTRQLQLLQPKLVVAVGRIAAHFLLKTNTSLGRLRGSVHQYGDDKIPLLVTYHPAYLLRTPRDKRKAYEDLLRVKEML